MTRLVVPKASTLVLCLRMDAFGLSWIPCLRELEQEVLFAVAGVPFDSVDGRSDCDGDEYSILMSLDRQAAAGDGTNTWSIYPGVAASFCMVHNTPRSIDTNLVVASVTVLAHEKEH